MDSNQIAAVLRTNERTDKVFLGCFASDRLPPPEAINHPAALIVNRDTHNRKGSHWMAIFATGLDRPVNYFDSLALPIPAPVIDTFLCAYTAGVRKNKRTYQSPFAPTCAPLCISFIHYMSFGYSYDHFLRILDTSQSPDLFSLSLIDKLNN